MFLFGFLRCLRGEYKSPHDLIVTRLMLSTLNGIYYVTPAGIIKFMELLDRIHIYMSNRDPDKYKWVYEEIDLMNSVMNSVINRHVIL